MVTVDIREKIESGSCPEHYMCTVATTCYEKEERIRICERCWINYCKQNNLEFVKNLNNVGV